MKNKPQSNRSRRQFIKESALGAGTLALSSLSLSHLIACVPAQDKKLGIALVGLGYYSEHKLAPALLETEHCHLAGIVTGTPGKKEKWQQKYQIPDKNCYTYETFDAIADNEDIDVVYVVLPNGMHAEYTIRGANAGKHMICEKPMANSVQEGREMVDACKKNNVLLQIGYRLHYDPYTRELKRLGPQKVLGAVKVIQTGDAFYGVGSKNWRFRDVGLSGGGAMMDIGVYCLQGCRYTTGEEPLWVTAQSFNTNPDQIIDMEETVLFQMEFPSGAVADCMASYAGRADYIRVSAEKGRFGLEPSYGYDAPQGFINDEGMSFAHVNQQAAQMDAFSRNILDKTPVIAGGEMGMKDLQVIEAIYKATETGAKVAID